MPKIIKNEAQEKALSEISDALSQAASLNTLLDNLDSGNIEIKFSDKAEKKKAKYVLSPKRGHALESLLKKEKNLYVKRVRQLAAKYKIMLDEDDEKILGEEKGSTVEDSDTYESKEDHLPDEHEDEDGELPFQ